MFLTIHQFLTAIVEQCFVIFLKACFKKLNLWCFFFCGWPFWRLESITAYWQRATILYRHEKNFVFLGTNILYREWYTFEIIACEKLMIAFEHFISYFFSKYLSVLVFAWFCYLCFPCFVKPFEIHLPAASNWLFLDVVVT